jgi:hypothetical protein
VAQDALLEVVVSGRGLPGLDRLALDAEMGEARLKMKGDPEGVTVKPLQPCSRNKEDRGVMSQRVSDHDSDTATLVTMDYRETACMRIRRSNGVPWVISEHSLEEHSDWGR